MLEITCQQCERKHHAGEEHLGKYLRCAGCGSKVLIAPKGGRLESYSALKAACGTAVRSSSPRTTVARHKEPDRRFVGNRTYLTLAILLMALIGSGSSFYRMRVRRGSASQAYGTTTPDPPTPLSASGIPTLDPSEVEEVRPPAGSYRRIMPTGTRFMKDLATAGTAN
jgi:DNA-directed RNA polymerase subunit RPC12/RpoP